MGVIRHLKLDLKSSLEVHHSPPQWRQSSRISKALVWVQIYKRCLICERSERRVSVAMTRLDDVFVVVIHRSDIEYDFVERLSTDRTLGLHFRPFTETQTTETVETSVGKGFVLYFAQTNGTIGFRTL